MAEVWYLGIEDINAETFKEKEPKYVVDFRECIGVLELTPKRRKCGIDEIPQFRTGNPAIDESGYIYVLAWVSEDDIDTEAIDARKGEWKPGWYLSPLSIIAVEKKLKQPSRPAGHANPVSDK